LYLYTSLLRPSPRHTLFPYTTLFRSIPQRTSQSENRKGLLPLRGSIQSPALAPCPQVWGNESVRGLTPPKLGDGGRFYTRAARTDQKSTRLNSSHVSISSAVFCLKKK